MSKVKEIIDVNDILERLVRECNSVPKPCEMVISREEFLILEAAAMEREPVPLLTSYGWYEEKKCRTLFNVPLRIA